MGQVYVVGSINMDIVVRSQELPRRGATIAGSFLSYLPGGKGANQAVAAAKMGVTTHMVGRVGNDPFGSTVLCFLTEQGVDCALVRESSAPTGTALIIVDELGDNMIVVVLGANGTVAPADVTGLTFRTGDVVVTQFEVPRATVTATLTRAHTAGATTILNPSPIGPVSPELSALADVLVVNEAELGLIARTSVPERASPEQLADAVQILNRRSEQTTIVTVGRNGAFAFADGDVLHVGGEMVATYDTTGAGDCFTGVLAAYLAKGASLEGALGMANVAASLSIQRQGAGPAMPQRAEVEAAARASGVVAP